MSKIGCVVLNYNDAENTAALVHHIENYASLDHIIVVDNVSTDDSVERLRLLVNEKVSLHISSKNGGYGFGNNFGIRIARESYGCVYVFIASPDARFEEETVAKVLNCFKESQKVKAVTAIQLLPNDAPYLKTAWLLPNKPQYIFSSLFLLRNFFDMKTVDIISTGKASVAAECLMGSFVCVESESFLSIGGFDENIFLYCEETALGFKFKAAGYEMRVATDTYYHHYHGTGSTYINIKSNITRRKMLLKNRKYILRQYMDAKAVTLLTADICYGIAIFEEYLKLIIRKIIK